MADIGRKRMVRVTYNQKNGVLYRASTYKSQIYALFFMFVATRLFQYISFIYMQVILLLDGLMKRQVDSNFDISANFSLHDFRR